MQAVNHKDGNKLNNHISNLEWISQAENCSHAVEIGLMDRKGSKHPLSKINEKEVLEMRRLFGLGYTHQKIADIFNICRPNVSMIVSRKRWKHI